MWRALIVPHLVGLSNETHILSANVHVDRSPWPIRS